MIADTATFEQWKAWSKTDDRLERFVLSDIRQMLGEITRLRAQLSAPADGKEAGEAVLPSWEDARVQLVYKLLCDDDLNIPPDTEEHWEGWISRNIVAALAAYPAPQAAVDQAGKMREALRPFADIALEQDHDPEAADMISGPDLAITPAQVRTARAALSAQSAVPSETYK